MSRVGSTVPARAGPGCSRRTARGWGSSAPRRYRPTSPLAAPTSRRSSLPPAPRSTRCAARCRVSHTRGIASGRSESRRTIMKVGIALNMLSEAGRTDVAVVADHRAMGDLAEPLGFDSLFALEHHFTGYAMSPAPLQLLAYYAGRTKRIMFGTAVIVLPWNDPIRVAEGIALLDILSGGRWLFGLVRGSPRVPYDVFRNSVGGGRCR